MKISKKLSMSEKYNEKFSLILFLLYKLKDDPKYSILSELPFVLDKSNLLNLLEYFGGRTITIPTKRDLLNIITALSLLEDEKMEIDEKSVDKSEVLHYYEFFKNNEFGFI